MAVEEDEQLFLMWHCTAVSEESIVEHTQAALTVAAKRGARARVLYQKGRESGVAARPVVDGMRQTPEHMADAFHSRYISMDSPAPQEGEPWSILVKSRAVRQGKC
jgi:hypothetical protein